jgi:hypothetical protein
MKCRVTLYSYCLAWGILLVGYCPVAVSQEVKVSGKFLNDSIRVGEPVMYTLTARYPQHLTVLFPDSTFNFAPFDYSKKQFVPTKTTLGQSYDSVVYHLLPFEIDKVQYLALPVFIPTARDCTVVTAARDSVFLIELVEAPPESVPAQSLPLKTNTLYENVWRQFNYFFVVLFCTALAIAALIIWVIFGKRIIKHFKLKKLQKKHQQFMEVFATHTQHVASLFSVEKTEHTLSIWKKYMEQLDHIPYTKLTTRETVRIIPDETLGQSLKSIDRAIYGSDTSVVTPLHHLQEFADKQFVKRFEEMKNG